MRIQLYAVPGLSSMCGLICCCRVRGPSGRLLSCRFVPARMGCAAEFMPTRRSGARTRIAAGPGQPGRCRAAGGRRFQPHAASTPSTLYPSWFVSTEWRFKWCCSAFILVWTAFSAAFDLFGRRGIYICFSSLHCQKIYKKRQGASGTGRPPSPAAPRRQSMAVRLAERRRSYAVGATFSGSGDHAAMAAAAATAARADRPPAPTESTSAAPSPINTPLPPPPPPPPPALEPPVIVGVPPAGQRRVSDSTVDVVARLRARRNSNAI